MQQSGILGICRLKVTTGSIVNREKTDKKNDNLEIKKTTNPNN